ncbi:MAG: hypothetical protein DRJ49_01605 [Thermoprotei archaeon]|nr:MAG: hypothetical protein DRJ49_01605 [Thermoprotei archaeon]RLG36092.1 MAG: hypothetical protein DRN91_08720 [Candidatus Alkanophagales archaeon]
MPRKYELVVTSLLASMAILFTLAKLQVPYPLIPFLKFDLAEIPSVLALLACNLYSAIAVAIIHFLFLNFRGEFVPIGPFMKLLAVLSTILGLRLVRSYIKKNGMLSYLVIIVPMLTRVLVMELANVLTLIFLLPYLLQFLDLKMYIIHVAIFNAIHTILVIVPSKLLEKYVHSLQKIYH